MISLFNREPESLIAAAKSNPQAREELIKQKEQAILKVASKTCSKYVSKSDDEWSVALCAFSRAIDSYDPARGSFMGLAATLIQRALIDYHRKEERYSPELYVSPAAFEGNSDEEEEAAVSYAVAQCSMAASDSGIQEEIASLSSVLDSFGFHFPDLPEVSPKQKRTRVECLKAASCLSANRQMYDRMMKNHQLPASEIAKVTGLSIKLLDKYRKYIITSSIILSDDYPYLAGYLRPLEGRQQT